jgi:hypothetical protein
MTITKKQKIALGITLSALAMAIGGMIAALVLLL